MIARGTERRIGNWLQRVLYGSKRTERREGYDRRAKVAPAHPMTAPIPLYRNQ